MTFQTGEQVRINPDRPAGWNKKAWEPYGGMPATVAESVQYAKGKREYRVLMQDGPLKGQHRWFKEQELQPVDQEWQEMSVSELGKLLHTGLKESES